MNKIDLLKKIYPNEISFEFDTATPHHICKDIAELLSAKMKREKNEIYEALFWCVYAYGKGSVNGQGFIPLTIQARMMLQYYLELTGINLFYIPAVDIRDI